MDGPNNTREGMLSRHRDFVSCKYYTTNPPVGQEGRQVTVTSKVTVTFGYGPANCLITVSAAPSF